MKEELPITIAGYQHVVLGPTQNGDIWVYHGAPQGFVSIETFQDVAGAHKSMPSGWNIYRKMPVARMIHDETNPDPKTFAGPAATPATKHFIPQDDKLRKRAPMHRGLIGYFPAALFEVATHSFESDEKHNPGAKDGPTWARDKSRDHADCIVRHLIDAGVRGTPNRRYHLRALAWRALALLQEECEDGGSLPGISSR